MTSTEQWTWRTTASDTLAIKKRSPNLCAHAIQGQSSRRGRFSTIEDDRQLLQGSAAHNSRSVPIDLEISATVLATIPAGACSAMSACAMIPTQRP